MRSLKFGIWPPITNGSPQREYPGCCSCVIMVMSACRSVFLAAEAASTPAACAPIMTMRLGIGGFSLLECFVPFGCFVEVH